MFSKGIEAKYSIKTKGIKIGALVWQFEEVGNNYKTSIYLKDEGMLSGIYSFTGEYHVVGKKINKTLVPKSYTQVWKTKNKYREVKMVFENFKIKNLKLSPVEKEIPRIEYKNLTGYSDPISSFLNILLNQLPSHTIDGRRVYLLLPTDNKNKLKILISEYRNIWADHKRNDLEYLEIFSSNSILPEKIKIMFKGSMFYLTKI